MQKGVATVGNSAELPAKLKIELLYHPGIPILGVHPKNESTNSERPERASVHYSPTWSSQDVEAAVSVD